MLHLPAVKMSAGVAPEVVLGKCTLHLPLQKKVNKAEPTLALKPRETSPEIQNRGTSGPKIGHVYVSDKNIEILGQKWSVRKCSMSGGTPVKCVHTTSSISSNRFIKSGGFCLC